MLYRKTDVLVHLTALELIKLRIIQENPQEKLKNLPNLDPTRIYIKGEESLKMSYLWMKKYQIHLKVYLNL